MLTSKKFLVAVFLTTILCGLAIVAFCVSVDPYALFHSTDGPRVRVYANERLSKHLFCYRYIPENFDSLLIGTSVSINMDTSKISALKVYNASLEGSNLYELKKLVDIVVQKRRLKVLFISLDPIMLRTHEKLDQFLDPEEYWVAFGSVDVAKAIWLRYRLGKKEEVFSPWGFSDFHQRMANIPVETAIKKKVDDLGPDDLLYVWNSDLEALRILQSLLVECKERGTRVIVFYPPMPERIMVHSRVHRLRFKHRLAKLLGDTEVIDFNDSDLVHETGFVDSAHLTNSNAAALVERLSRELR